MQYDALMFVCVPLFVSTAMFALRFFFRIKRWVFAGVLVLLVLFTWAAYVDHIDGQTAPLRAAPGSSLDVGANVAALLMGWWISVRFILPLFLLDRLIRFLYARRIACR